MTQNCSRQTHPLEVSGGQAVLSTEQQGIGTGIFIFRKQNKTNDEINTETLKRSFAPRKRRGHLKLLIPTIGGNE
jgi:hypothetical protein